MSKTVSRVNSFNSKLRSPAPLGLSLNGPSRSKSARSKAPLGLSLNGPSRSKSARSKVPLGLSLNGPSRSKARSPAPLGLSLNGRSPLNDPPERSLFGENVYTDSDDIDYMFLSMDKIISDHTHFKFSYVLRSYRAMKMMESSECTKKAMKEVDYLLDKSHKLYLTYKLFLNKYVQFRSAFKIFSIGVGDYRSIRDETIAVERLYIEIKKELDEGIITLLEKINNCSELNDITNILVDDRADKLIIGDDEQLKKIVEDLDSVAVLKHNPANLTSKSKKTSFFRRFVGTKKLWSIFK